MSRGLQQFNILLSSKTFILLFIRTLEREKEFNVRDKVSVASLLSAALQNRMEYHTECVLLACVTLLLSLMQCFSTGVPQNLRVPLLASKGSTEPVLTCKKILNWVQNHPGLVHWNNVLNEHTS